MNGLVILKHKGHRIPIEYLSKACEVFPNGFGIMFRSNQGLVVSPADRSTNNDPEDIQESLNLLKDQECFLFLRRGTERMLDEASRQPITLLTARDSGVPLIAMVAGGAFDLFRQDGKHDPQRYMADMYLKPLLSVYDDAGYEPNEILGDSTIEIVMKHIIRDKATVIGLMTRGGYVKIFGSQGAEMGATFTWGWTLNHLGFAQRKQGMVSRVLEPSKLPHNVIRQVPSKGQGTLALEATSAITPAKVSSEQLKAAQNAITNLETEGGRAVSTPILMKKMMSPPAELKSKQQKGGWYDKFAIEGRPTGYKNGPEVEVYVTQEHPHTPVPMKRVIELQESGGSHAPASAPSTPASTTVVNRPGTFRPRPASSAPKPEAPVAKPEVPAEEAEPAEETPTASPSLIPEKSRNVVAMVWKSEGDKEITDPKVSKTEAADIPEFTEQIGLKDLSETFNWTRSFMLKQAPAHPEAMVALWHQTKETLIICLEQLDKVQKDYNELLEKVTAPAEKEPEKVVEEPKPVPTVNRPRPAVTAPPTQQKTQAPAQSAPTRVNRPGSFRRFSQAG